MARVVVVLIAVALATVTSSYALDSKLTGTPEGLVVVAGDLEAIMVEVKGSWLPHQDIELDIEVTGNDGLDIHHGRAIVPVSSMMRLSSAGTVAPIRIAWDDQSHTHVGEAYTACIQVRVSGHRVGDMACTDFAPGEY